MAQLIDHLLNLARVSRGEMRHEQVDLSAMAKVILTDLQNGEPQRSVECVVPEGVAAEGDPRLLRVVLENLLGNAWKFTRKKLQARIELGVAKQDGQQVYFVRDDGAGFDMTYVGKLFGTFQRLHTAQDFSGSGCRPGDRPTHNSSPWRSGLGARSRGQGRDHHVYALRERGGEL
jgi:light-regulated signal transduction histidine kinase (bacteriophytochrome)